MPVIRPYRWLFGFNWGLHALTYILVAFYLPLMYGSWRFVGFHYLIGPFISDINHHRSNEYSAFGVCFPSPCAYRLLKLRSENICTLKPGRFIRSILAIRFNF